MILPPDSASAGRIQDARRQGPSATATRASEGHPPPAGSGGCPDRPRITKDQRDALYDVILSRLIAIDDLWRAIDAEDFEKSERLAREYTDLLLLILNDLGWGSDGEALELTMPAEDLHRVFGLFHKRAARAFPIEQAEEAEVREARQENQLVLDACKVVFTTIDVQAMRA
ncbi:MAG TPA: hypothetical protein VGO66_12945 [Solirubrobacterales bacterium]|nr:hypothetical protein [Solirubrobacterales bacterium]